jgi:hypothetical protein
MQSLQTERLLNNTIIGAYHGAAIGTCLTTAITSISAIFILAMQSFIAALELGSRRAGHDPRWLMNMEEDCKLETFQNLPQCHEEPMFDSGRSFIIYTIGVGTLMGMFLGAIINGVVEHMVRPNREIVGN